MQGVVTSRKRSSGLLWPGLVLGLVIAVGVLGYLLWQANQPVVLAKVNGVDITQDDFYQRLVRAKGQQEMDKMVEEILIEQEASRLGIRVTGVEVDQRVARLRAEFSSEEEFLRVLGEYGFTLGGLQESVERNLVVEKILTQNLRITDEQLLAYFNQNRDYFDQYERVHLRHIHLNDWDTARSVVVSLTRGESFAELARRHSIDRATASRGGDMGFIYRGELPPVLDEAIFALQVGEFSRQPVESEYGYHIFFVEEKFPYKAAVFGEVKDRVRDLFIDDFVDENKPLWLMDLKARSTIRVLVDL